MTPFRRQESRERTAEEREIARRERAADRAAREGRPPPEPAPSEPPEAALPERVAPDPSHGAVADPHHDDVPSPNADVADVPSPNADVADVPAPEPEPEPQPPRQPEPRADLQPVVPSELELEPESRAEVEPPAEDDSGVRVEPERRAEDESPHLEAPPEPEPPRGPEPEPARGPAAASAPDHDRVAPPPEPRRDRDPDRPLRLIAPDPPAPPPAPAGSLSDEVERPLGTRRVRAGLPRRDRPPVMTPPGDVPQGPRPRRSARRVVGTLALVILGAVLLWLANALWQPFGGEGEGRVAVRIAEGSSARDIGDTLATAGVVDSSLIFSLRATISGKRDELRSGRHVLRRDMSYGAALDVLSTVPRPRVVPRPRTVKLTVPEGRSRIETRTLVRRAGVRGNYLQASRRARGDFSPRRYGAPRRPRSLEGFLFPATYELRRSATARTLVARQLDAFADTFGEVDLRAARRRNLTAYDVLIIA